MKFNVSKIAGYLLGLIFFVFGAAGLLSLLPPPADMPEDLQTFMMGMKATGYFFPFLKSTEALCGLLLLLGIAPALMLIILAPITIQIVLLHSFLTPDLKSLLMPLIMLTLHLSAARQYWRVYRPLFSRNKTNIV